jgi:hypothetical protein
MKELRGLLSDYNKNRNAMRSLCKYMADSDDVIDGIFHDHQIRFTQPWGLNDPLEFNPAIKLTYGDDEINYTRYSYRGVTIPSYYDWIYINLIESRYNRYGILSLTYEPFSYAMWNLYANAHKGFLIDFGSELDEEKCFRSFNLISGPVEYVEKYEIRVSTRIGEEGFHSFDDLNYQLFLTKTDHWKKEREYRVVRPLSECPYYVKPCEPKSYRDYKVYLFGYDIKYLKSIVFGASMDPEKKRRIIEFTSTLHIEYLQALLDKSYNCSIYYLPISAWGNIDRFLTMKPQVFITDGTKFKNSDRHQTINDLSELSYFDESPLMEETLMYLRSKGIKE